MVRDKDTPLVITTSILMLTGASAMKRLYIERNWDPLIYDLNCTGREDSIWNCPQNGRKEQLSQTCTNDDDASVICQQCKAV